MDYSCSKASIFQAIRRMGQQDPVLARVSSNPQVAATGGSRWAKRVNVGARPRMILTG